MATMMEKKSTRILALLLALIMIGSVLAYAFRKPTKAEERSIKFDMGNDLKDWLRYIPNSTEFIMYFNYNTTNETLLKFIYNMTARNIDPYAFYIFRPYVSSFKRLLIGSPELYFIDVGRQKVYFTYNEKRDYYGYDVLFGNFSRRMFALVKETHPVIYGYPDSVIDVLKVITNNGTSLEREYYNYTKRINGTFNFAMLVTGEVAKDSIKSNGTPIADFYFEGFRMNGSMFEKVVAIHFLGNYFFVHSNKTAYYYCKNYNDGFSIAVMDDYNLTKLINTTPEMRAIIIKMGK